MHSNAGTDISAHALVDSRFPALSAAGILDVSAAFGRSGLEMVRALSLATTLIQPRLKASPSTAVHKASYQTRPSPHPCVSSGYIYDRAICLLNIARVDVIPARGLDPIDAVRFPSDRFLKCWGPDRWKAT